MAAVLRVINFYERDNIEGQRLPRVFNFHLPWEDFSDDELLKGYRFGREYLLFIARERSGGSSVSQNKLPDSSF